MNNNSFINNPIISFRLNALEELLIQISSRLEEIEEKLNALKLETIKEEEEDVMDLMCE
nr:MAG: hypothetical protein [Lake Baikal virophage 9]